MLIAPVAAVPDIVATSLGELGLCFFDKEIGGTGQEELVIVIPVPAVKLVTFPVPNDCHAAPS